MTETRIATGVLLNAVGATGLLPYGQAVTATSQTPLAEPLGVMDVMMDARHGLGATGLMHQTIGEEEMMEACAAMMSPHHNMMEGGMMRHMGGSGR